MVVTSVHEIRETNDSFFMNINNQCYNSPKTVVYIYFLTKMLNWAYIFFTKTVRKRKVL